VTQRKLNHAENAQNGSSITEACLQSQSQITGTSATEHHIIHVEVELQQLKAGPTVTHTQMD